MSGRFVSKKKKAAGSLAAVLISAAFVLAALALMLWVCLYVHPADSISKNKSGTAKKDLSSAFSTFSVDTASEALSEVADAPETIEAIIPEIVPEETEPEETVYRIADDALCGEVPNPDCYGSSKDPADVEAVIARAAELLDGQELIWNRDLPFWDAKEISWYYDETILVISWTELDKGVITYFSEVKIADASQFRRMLAGGTYGAVQQLKCSAMAKSANAVLASNADFYAFRVTGTNVYEGTLYRCNPGLDDCYIDTDGNLIFSPANALETEDDVLRFIAENNINFSISFGPILVNDGVAITSNSYPVGQGSSVAARCAIAQTDELHYVIANINYADLITAAGIMSSHNIRNAYAMDGGQTGETILGGNILNEIVHGSERNVSDIIYFATAYPWEDTTE